MSTESQKYSSRDEESTKNESLEQQISDNLQREVEDQKISEYGISADQFDVEPKIEERITAEEENEFADKQAIQIHYGFRGEEVREALTVFQKNTIYKKNMIYSLIIVVLFGIYLLQLINQPNSNFSVFMCVITLAVLGIIWFFPKNHIRQMVKTIDAQEYKEEYLLSVYDNAVIVGDGPEKDIFYFDNPKIRVWETEELFIIGYEKIRVFVIPKRCCDGHDNEISHLFAEGLKNNYQKS